MLRFAHGILNHQTGEHKAEDDDTLLTDAAHRLIAQQELCSTEYCFFYCHCFWIRVQG